jgi:SAM-dependent methyltransferase
MDLSDPKFLSNQDSGGYFPTLEDAQRYEEGVKRSDYHADRLRALKKLIDEINGPISSVLDFGVGDGGATEALGLKPTHITGIDISDSMIRLAESNLSEYTFIGKVGSAEQISSVASGSIDLVLCLNVLGYLTRNDQELFFQESSRVLKKDGYLLLMTGNELFDLFALNSGTAEFFEKHFNQTDVSELLSQGNSSRFKNADRRNPLNFAAEMKDHGFDEIAQAFSSWHKLTPAVANLRWSGDLRTARAQSRDHSFDPNSLPNIHAWKRLFCCSIFASLLRKI